MAHDAPRPSKPEPSILRSTLINPIDVPASPNRATAWQDFGQVDPFATFSSPISSFSDSPLPQEPGYGLQPSFQGEFQTGEVLRPGYELLVPNRHRNSLSSSSGSSLSDPPSPLALDLLDAPPKALNLPTDTDAEGDDAPWNLVAYHIPWGSAYAGYKSGTLPGPDGTCIFLRSPTPTKRQRTSQACEKCRERKAKCSGSRPACARCQSRGHDCFYSPSPVPDSQASSSRSSSLLRTSRSPSNASERPKVKEAVRIRHKASLAHNDRSIRNRSLKASSPESGDGLEVPSFGDDFLGTWNNASQSQYPRLSILGSEETSGTFPASPLEPPSSASSASSFGSSVDSESPPQTLSSLFPGREHNLHGMSAPLYVESPSGLDNYRFPPLSHLVDDVKPVAIAQPQPQPLCHTSLPQLTLSSLQPSAHEQKMSWDNPAWFGQGELSGIWPDAVSARAMEMEMELTEALPQIPISSRLLSRPGSSPNPPVYHEERYAPSSGTLFPHTNYGQLSFYTDRVDEMQSCVPAFAHWSHDKAPEHDPRASGA